MVRTGKPPPKQPKRKRPQVADDPPLPANDPALLLLRSNPRRKAAPKATTNSVTVPPNPPAQTPQSNLVTPLNPPVRPHAQTHQTVPTETPSRHIIETLRNFIPPGEQLKEPVFKFNGILPLDYSKDKATWDQMKKNKARTLPTMYPVHKDLKVLKIFDEVNSIMTDGNLGFMMWDDPGTYNQLVWEFVSTLNVVWRTKEQGTSETPKRWAHKWYFQINGFFHCLEEEEEEFEKIFKYQWTDSSFTTRSTKENTEFWRYITQNDSITFLSGSCAKFIRLPAWRIIHRLVAENLNTRLDRSARVTHRDLDIMRTIYKGKGKGVKLMSLLSELFVRNLTSKVLGGGAAITLIAKHLGYILDPAKKIPPYELGIPNMRSSLMIDSKNNWKKEPFSTANTTTARTSGDAEARLTVAIEDRLKSIEDCQVEMKNILQTILQHIEHIANTHDTPAAADGAWPDWN